MMDIRSSRLSVSLREWATALRSCDIGSPVLVWSLTAEGRGPERRFMAMLALIAEERI